jgi:hypothetical protein
MDQYQLGRVIHRNPLIFAEILLTDFLEILGRSLDKPNEPAQDQDTGFRVILLGKVPRALKTREQLRSVPSFTFPATGGVQLTISDDGAGLLGTGIEAVRYSFHTNFPDGVNDSNDIISVRTLLE